MISYLPNNSFISQRIFIKVLLESFVFQFAIQKVKDQDI